MSTLLAPNHHSRINDDTRKPGAQRRLALKRSQPRISPAQTVVYCVLFVPEDVERNPMKLGRITREDLLLRARISTDSLLNERLLFINRRGINDRLNIGR
jgi:hypothetical protein